jgi:hypothetical protein
LTGRGQVAAAACALARRLRCVMFLAAEPSPSAGRLFNWGPPFFGAFQL